MKREVIDSGGDIPEGYSEYNCSIPEFRVRGVLGKLKGLSDRAVKLGMSPYIIDIDEPRIEARHIGGRKQNIQVVPIRLVAAPPQVPGWKFVAKIDHDDPVNEVKGFGAQSLIDEAPEAFKFLTTCEPNCEHCNVKRRRNTTFVFRSTDSTKTIQVGSTCIGDFTGAGDPEAVVSLANHFAEILAEVYADDDEMSVGGSGFIFREMREVLATATSIVRLDGGWVPRDRAGASGCTVDWITQVMNDPKTQSKLLMEGDWVQADKIMEWLRSDNFEVGTDVYRSNLKAMAMKGHVKPKMWGFAGSAVATYARERKMAKARQAERERPSVALGAVNEKLKLAVRVDKKVPIDTAFGMSVLHVMTDLESGGKITWFNSGAGKFVEGEAYTITGRVKAHKTRDGLLETQMTRVNCPDLVLHDKIIPGMDEKALLKKLRKLDRIDAPNVHGETLLYVASHVYRYRDEGRAIIQELLARGAFPGAQSNRSGNNAFDYWVDARDAELIAYGLEHHPEMALRWTDNILRDYGLADELWTERLREVRNKTLLKVQSCGDALITMGARDALSTIRGGDKEASEPLVLVDDDDDQSEGLRLA